MPKSNGELEAILSETTEVVEIYAKICADMAVGLLGLAESVTKLTESNIEMKAQIAALEQKVAKAPAKRARKEE